MAVMQSKQANDMETEGPELIDDVMTEVIGKLGSITEHLRRIQCDKAANRISKYTHHIAVEFGNVVPELTDSEIVMNLPTNKTNGIDSKSDMHYVHNECRKIEVQLREPEEKISLDLVYSNSRPLPLQGNNMWAKVAAAAPSPSQVHQMNGLHGMSPPTTRHNKIPLVPIPPGVQAMPPPVIMGGLSKMAGIIIVEGKFKIKSLNMLTARICEGALYSIEIDHRTGFAEIIFQNATHAREFLDKDKIAIENTDHGRFGNGFKVRHDKYKERVWDEDLARMEEGPLRERRRLTFVRPKLLVRPDALRTLEVELERIAGSDGIDFVWKFNAGNVTAVFKSVRTARLVRYHFLRKASQHGSRFAGIRVTYSADPCEKQLILTQNEPKDALYPRLPR
ncbi:hypothetical protein ACJ72_06992 [Emergomyces africanus]|uniref:RRM domain-containing protein n=1 Tax=Emergomyces africanus TaxID=1955775 RepID=A0A1B7NPV8_9EURO|nr:hypothetical protein ACJ72_06992 [Emergomyces africanus]